ncbi:hypothetical protein CDCA_CDCA14G3893 [Cyanidium caldarium]|uniref:Mitochondrial inner membrane protease subunit 2 n=1 Tax=Cyanidium caldarium TaxID=2771 RepID=A0AAV9IZV2_CYACA|nr:hypothetical protein CDCA_CDCA14G3893 [Cyanidium caldarium]
MTLRRATWKAASWLPVWWVTNDVLVSVSPVEGTCMQPVLNPAPPRDHVLVNRLAPRLYQFRRGDIVTAQAPDGSGRKVVVKRLVALEGDSVRHRETGRVVRVPRGHCWLEGDSTRGSRDSGSDYGAVPLGLIEGRVMEVVWPLNRCGKLRAVQGSGWPQQGRVIVGGSGQV